eukprot:2850697-Amphidinium_carterae.1
MGRRCPASRAPSLGREEFELTHSPSVRASRTALADLGDGAGTPSTWVISDDTPEPDQTRPP